MSVLTATGLTKSYGGVAALSGVDLALEPGQVHALLGENGAGKSTLVRILTGVVGPDEGSITVGGAPCSFAGPADAVAAGIAVVSQELTLFPDLDLLGNLFLTHLPTKGPRIDRAAMAARAAGVLADVGITLDPATPAGRLTLAQRQLLEIAKALLHEPRVLVLDEPTSALDEAESRRLLRIIDVARARGAAVVFVTHILEEVLVVSDVVSVLRDGRLVTSAVPTADLNIADIVAAMLGDKAATLSALHAEGTHGSGGAGGGAAGVVAPGVAGAAPTRALRVEGLAGPGFAEVSFTVATGEVVGLAGVVGSGHLALIEGLSGTRPVRSGAVGWPGRTLGPAPTSRIEAVADGVAVVSGDRSTALLHDASVWENLACVESTALGRSGRWLSTGRLRAAAAERARSVGAKLATVDQPVGSLSGGNQQKVVLASWLAAQPRVVLLDDPTRGVDVGAKAEIHALLRRTCADRIVVLASTDIDELVTVCDRVLVFRGGRVRDELTGPSLTRGELLTRMNAVDSVAS